MDDNNIDEKEQKKKNSRTTPISVRSTLNFK